MTTTVPPVDDPPLATRHPTHRRGAAAPPPTRRLARAFAVVLLVVAALHAGATMLPEQLDFPGRSSLSVLDLGGERSIGTWLNSLLHLACAVLAGTVAVLARDRGERWVGNWWALAALFTAMSADEVAAFHDRLLVPLREALGADGVFYYAWVLPALVLGAVFLAAQVGFLRHLDRRTRRGLLLAGAVFVAGAAGLEMAEGLLDSMGLREHALFGVLVMVEELVEMGALMGVVCVLLRHLLRAYGTPQLVLVAAPTGPAPRAHP